MVLSTDSQRSLVTSIFRRCEIPAGIGTCTLVAWWVPTWDEFRDRTTEQNAAQRSALFDAGEWDVYAIYEDGVPLGTCQCGPRDRLEKCIASISENHADAEFCIWTGDIVHWGDEESYRLFQEAISALPIASFSTRSK